PPPGSENRGHAGGIPSHRSVVPPVPGHGGSDPGDPSRRRAGDAPAQPERIRHLPPLPELRRPSFLLGVPYRADLSSSRSAASRPLLWPGPGGSHCVPHLPLPSSARGGSGNPATGGSHSHDRPHPSSRSDGSRHRAPASTCRDSGTVPAPGNRSPPG